MIAAMAEWLRRLTRNQMGSTRVGSNPTRSVVLILDKTKVDIDYASIEVAYHIVM